jgi:hypothetical protein
VSRLAQRAIELAARHGLESRARKPPPRHVELPTDLAEWEGWCLELVNELLRTYPDSDILYVDLMDHPRWTYHAAIVVDGIVHDAWHPDVRLPPAEYVRKVFGCEGATWEFTWELNPGADED